MKPLGKNESQNRKRSLNFLTPNFILEEKKHKMDMQMAYIWTSITSNAQFSYAVQFLVLMSAGIVAKLPPYYLKLYFAVSDSL